MVGQTHELTSAVCNAGGLGSLACAALTIDSMRNELRALQGRTDRSYNVNFFCHTQPTPNDEHEVAWQSALMPYYQEFDIDTSTLSNGAGRLAFTAEMVDALGEFRPRVVSFHFGLPAADLVAKLKALGTIILSSATTVDEALWLQAHGADAIIAQGLEAGGHRGMFLTDDLSTQVGTFALLPQIVQAVRLPVIAAGGIADANGVAAAMALGASGVQIGTAYLLCDEAATPKLHRAALSSDAAKHTALTRLFTGRPARSIMNRLMRELGPLNPIAPSFPLATSALAPLRAKAEAVGLGDFTPLWAGQNVSGCKAISAATLTAHLVRGFSFP